MANFTMAKFFLCGLFPFIWISIQGRAQADKVVIHANIGQNITLTYSSEDLRITDNTGILYNRTDLKGNYVLFYRDGRSDSSNQDPRYTGRVEFVHFTDTISMIIKNSSVIDSGTFELKLIQGGGQNGNIFDVPPKRTFDVIVTEPENNGPDEKIRGEAVTAAVTPPAVTPPPVTPPPVTPPAVTDSAITPPAVTPPAVTPPAVTPPAVTPPAVTPPAVTDSAITPSAVTPPPVTPSAVTPSARGRYGVIGSFVFFVIVIAVFVAFACHRRPSATEPSSDFTLVALSSRISFE